MQDVSDVPIDRAAAAITPRAERLTGGTRSASAREQPAAQEPTRRELLSTRLVRAELMRLRRPGSGDPGASTARRD